MQLFMFIACWLVPIRGVFLLSGTVSGFANMLSGDPSGVTDIYWGIAGGLAGEVALAAFRSRPEKRSWIVIVAGLLYIPATNVVTFYVFGWTVNAAFYAGIVIALAAITLESSLPAIGLGRWVMRTGLLRAAPIPLASSKVTAAPRAARNEG
jgi:ABC-type thiamin/hydroxymethylpyrimidine transport system permease subunit